MAVGAVLGALASVAGTVGGMSAGTNTRTMSTLTPMQQMQMMQMIGALNPRMEGHFSKLGEIGQGAQNSYGSMPSFMSDYVGKVQTPARMRQRDMSRQIGDPAHERAQGIAQNQFNQLQMLGSNQLRNRLMMQDLGMRTAGQDSSWNRQLGALGQMGETWMMPMGKTRENYMMQQTPASAYVGAGIAGIGGLVNAFDGMRSGTLGTVGGRGASGGLE